MNHKVTVVTGCNDHANVNWTGCAKCESAALRAENLGLMKSLKQAEEESIALRAEVERLKGELEKVVECYGKEYEMRDSALRKLKGISALEAEVERLRGNWNLAQKANDYLYRMLTKTEAERDRALRTLESVREWCDRHGFDKPTNMNKVVPMIRAILDGEGGKG